MGYFGSARITNTSAQDFPTRALRELAPMSVRKGIDLAWTHTILWRAMVAPTLDPLLCAGSLRELVVAGEPGNSSFSLMITWLRLRLDIPVTRANKEDFKGVSSIIARTDDGGIIITRHDLKRVTIMRPGSPEPQMATMTWHESVSALNEELRRLTPDFVCQEVLATLLKEPVSD